MATHNPTEKPKEYQTYRVFAILGVLTALVVIVFKVVLFAPQNSEKLRIPAQSSAVESSTFDAAEEKQGK